MRYLSRCLLVLAFVSFGVSAQNVVTTSPASPALDTSPDVYRSTSKIGSNAPTLQACIDAIKADAATRAPGTYAYSCRPGITSITATVTAPPPCPPAPANETRPQTCPAGTTGSWTQVRTYNSAPQPTCWVAGEWLPLTAPAGACVTPPPPTGGAVTIEAESGAVAGGANKQAVGGNASGGSIAAIFTSGASITWTVNDAGGGARAITFRYANAGGAASMGLYYAGARVATVAFAPTGSWDTFANSAPSTVTLAAGANSVMVRRDATDTGSVDFDTLTLTPTTPPPPCPAKPADETRTQTCPAGTTGSWSQTRSYDSAPSPACWVAGAWAPASAPAGACTPVVGTGTATLTWDAVPDARVIGYRVYWGTAPRTYSQPLGAGVLVTSTTHQVTGLPAGATYYFAVTAVAEGSESGYSNEVSKAMP